MARIVPKKGRRFRPDYTLALLVYILILIGLVAVFSASVVMSYQATGNPNFYFTRQLLSVGIGTLIFLFVSRIHYDFWRKIAPFLFVINLFLLVLVFLPGIGFGSGGAHRWIKVGNIIFQPTEALKISLIIFLAYFFDRVGKNIKTFTKGFFPFLIILGVLGGLIMKQPDMGTFFVAALISVAMFFVAGANLLHMGSLFALGSVGIWLLIKSAPYRMSRFMVFLDPGADAGGAGYQINQALLSIGTGGLLGLGFGQSRQKYQYLPEAATDSIFAIMSEELGFIRISIIIVIFAMLIYRGYRLSRVAPDNFSRFVAVGVTSWIAGQTFVNISAMLSLVPLTGVPLPFISYGGSSVIFLLLAFGIMINISKYRLEAKK